MGGEQEEDGRHGSMSLSLGQTRVYIGSVPWARWTFRARQGPLVSFLSLRHGCAQPHAAAACTPASRCLHRDA